MCNWFVIAVGETADDHKRKGGKSSALSLSMSLPSPAWSGPYAC